MDEEPNSQEQEAVAAEARRVDELFARVDRAWQNVEAAEASGDQERALDAILDAADAGRDVLRARVGAGRWGDAPGFGFTEAEATRELLWVREFAARRLISAVVKKLVSFAFRATGDPEMAEAREQALAALVRSGWVTAHELRTYPEASLTAIAMQRIHDWSEAN